MKEVTELGHVDIWGKSILVRGKDSEARTYLEYLENKREVNVTERLSGSRIVEDDFRKVTGA